MTKNSGKATVTLPIPCSEEKFVSLERANNVVTTSKYTWYNFVPKCLFLQFKRFTNTFFLVMVILMGLGYYIPTLFLSPYQPWGTFMVLVFVLAVTFTFEGTDDLRRHRADNSTNRRTSHLLRSSKGESVGTVGSPREVEWGSLIAGDVICIRNRELVPADVVILSSSSNGKCYIETSGIDGETNLKIKEVSPTLKSHVKSCQGWEKLLDKTSSLEHDAPSSLLSFTGAFTTSDGKVPLDFGGLILRGSELRNTRWVVAMVVYAGEETKLVLSSKTTPSKFSLIDEMVNRAMWMIMILYFLLILICDMVLLFGVEDTDEYWYFQYTSSIGEFILPGWIAYLFTFSLLFSNLIPIDILVCLEMANMIQSWFVNSDVRMYHEETDTPAEVKTTNLVAELGQITHVFSDKTGTLTRNEMRLVGISVNGHRYGFSPIASIIDTQSDEDNDVHLTVNEEEVIVDMESPDREKKEEITAAGSVRAHDLQESTDGTKGSTDAETTISSAQRYSSVVNTSATPRSPSVVNTSTTPRSSSVVNVINDVARRSSIKAVEVPFAERVRRSEDLAKSQQDLFQDLINLVHQESGASDDGSNSEQRENMVDFLILLAVCHTVVIDHDDEGNVRYNAEGPDEEALVSAAATFGFRLTSTEDQLSIVHVDNSDVVYKYKVLAVNSFNSTRKRMSVVVRKEVESTDSLPSAPSTSYMLLAKGADNVMFERLDSADDSVLERKLVLEEHLRAYAECGLRTLVMGKRSISSAEFDEWIQGYHDALAKTGSERGTQLANAAAAIELDFQLVGASAIEDKLQEGVPEAIHTIRNAGITLWVLTGDKVETAVNIAFSAKLLDNSMYKFELIHGDRETLVQEIDQLLELVRTVANETNSPRADSEPAVAEFLVEGLALVISGTAIEALVLEQRGTEESQAKFLQLLHSCKVVLGCRVSPAQKALIVRIVSNGPTRRGETRPVSLAIGDGANDVAMIQEARVGIGISGKEGLQAVNSSDFSIAQFRFLARLMLVHGRWNYRRNVKMLHYVTFSWMVLTFCLFIYLLYSLMSGQQLYFETFYVTLFAWLCNMVIVAVAWFDRDLRQESVIRFPDSYVNGRLNLDMRTSEAVKTTARAIIYTLVIWIAHIVLLPIDAGIQGLGTSSYVGLVVAMTFRQAWITNTYVWVVLLAFIFVSFLSFLAVWVFGDFAYNATSSYTWTPTVWMLGALYLFEILFAKMPRLYFPSDLDVMTELDRGYILGKRSTPRAVFDALHVFGQTARHLTIGPILVPAVRVKRALEKARKKGTLKNITKLSTRSGFDFASVNEEVPAAEDKKKESSGNLSARLMRKISGVRNSVSHHRTKQTSGDDKSK